MCLVLPLCLYIFTCMLLIISAEFERMNFLIQSKLCKIFMKELQNNLEKGLHQVVLPLGLVKGKTLPINCPYLPKGSNSPNEGVTGSIPAIYKNLFIQG